MRYREHKNWYGDTITIPEHIRNVFIRYFEHGYEPGSFSTAVLANDLHSAVARADTQNRHMLAEITAWVALNAPEGSWGNYDLVRDWVNQGPAFQAHQKALTYSILKEE